MRAAGRNAPQHRIGEVGTLAREPSDRVERLLFFGRLVEGKGVPDALDALAAIVAMMLLVK